ncbi:heme ABC transporter ATP-binding protein [Rhodophyticola sp. CCM32]|uniref:heme ABC transporter ATP-binding protein n=1 Tax=Rhodophyticola sp. CCM32 TaxID=2916397 RepID=UPI00107EF117|nr:heme ABC transporter ATP-binding protein [Rhodophyticola sp. CCM32]QBY01478.1 heme ABC transporter ATP-binding protein [Rhodophyticola sp. CCM32]
MLNATDIRVSLGRSQVLHGVDFTARPGILTAIVGPNGSGKTTLLRALTAEVEYTGQITLDGAALSQMRHWQLASRRAVLPQSTRLAFPFTVLEVVRLGLMAGQEATRADLPHEALASVGLAGFEGRFYQELSGGEQQRVQLARILTQVWEPVKDGQARWLFLDEPVSSLDIAHQLEVMTLARRYADAGGGVIAVMHDLNLTAMFAGSVALIEGGRLVRQDTPGAVLTDDLLSQAYGCALKVSTPPQDGSVFVLPQTAQA